MRVHGNMVYMVYTAKCGIHVLYKGLGFVRACMVYMVGHTCAVHKWLTFVVTSPPPVLERVDHDPVILAFEKIHFVSTSESTLNFTRERTHAGTLHLEHRHYTEGKPAFEVNLRLKSQAGKLQFNVELWYRLGQD